MKTSVLFNLVPPKNAILSCFFIIIDLYFLILAVITKIFNPATELEFSTAIPTTDVRAKIETQPLKEEAKISRSLI